jgi:hypothetical protein
VPFHKTCEVERNCLPVTVSVNALPPAVALAGDSTLAVGAGFEGALIVKVCEPDVPPPGAGFTIVTLGVPALAKSLEGTCAVRLVLEVKVVARAVPFHSTTEEDMNPVPVAVRVVAAAPAVAVVGLIELNAGVGLEGVPEPPVFPVHPPPQPVKSAMAKICEMARKERTGRRGRLLDISRPITI